MIRRYTGSPTLFAVIYTIIAAGIYFSLGAVGSHAYALTPVVYLAGGVFFVLLAALTYVEGASMHRDRGGATVFARYAFNELWSFVAGWALLLDYIIIIAATTFAATGYLGAFWGHLGRGPEQIVLQVAFIGYVGLRNIMGFHSRRAERVRALVLIDVALHLVLIVAGLILFFSWHRTWSPVHLGSAPTWSGLVFACGLVTVVFTGLESASGLSGEVAIGRGGLKRLVVVAAAVVGVLYVGIGLVAVDALPSIGVTGRAPGDWMTAPMLSVAQAFDDRWGTSAVTYVVGAAGALTLIAGANSAMLGLSRLAYSLATNRQIPSAVGRLHPKRSTPFVVIVFACLLAAAIGIPTNTNFMVGILAFGSLLGLTIAHLSVCVLRYKEPDLDRPYRSPLSVRIGGGDLPIPSAIGAVVSAAAWVSVMVTHAGARYVGLGWMAAGLTLYVAYRKARGKSLTKRLTVPEQALRGARARGRVRLDPRPAVRHAARRRHRPDGGAPGRRRVGRRGLDEEGAIIEALWVFEVRWRFHRCAGCRRPARARPRRAAAGKAVGEEYQGVTVADRDGAGAPDRSRDRRGGAAPRRRVDRARRRGAVAHPRRRPHRRTRHAGQLRGGGHQVRGDKAPCRVISRRRPPAIALRPTDEPAMWWILWRRAPDSLWPMFLLIVGAGRVGSQVAKSRWPRDTRYRARRGPAVARAARRGPADDVGGRRRPLHRRPGDRGRGRCWRRASSRPTSSSPPPTATTRTRDRADRPEEVRHRCACWSA